MWCRERRRDVVAVSREVVDAPAVAAAGARLRDCGEQVPRPPTTVFGSAAGRDPSVSSEVSRFEAVWGDGLSAVRSELGLLATALQQASWTRQNLERVSAQLLSHVLPTSAGDVH
ncbi:hypothetical protein GCM10009740_21400 [Terrabacter terrae]|uniref:Uncharacterized protein n=1 Tax=Terrabacter terrae TaxID=318434 RepID=A0ABN2U9B4_9MICO